MRINGFDIAVCSWSLQPQSTARAIARARKMGFHHYQLALRPLMFLDENLLLKERMAIATSGMIITAGMLDFPGEDDSTIDTMRATSGLVSNEDWPMRQMISHQAASIACDLGIGQISLNVGAIPAHADSEFARICGRVRALANIFADYKIELLIETGPDYPDTLMKFLDHLACPNVGVNFDPAAMILYGTGDPIETIELLGSNISHVHVRDAVASQNPGVEWGNEVAFGTGEVNANSLIDALKRMEFEGYLSIECQAKGDPLKNIDSAIAALKDTEVPM